MEATKKDESAATPTAAPAVEMPSAARVKRVEQVLRSDATLKERLGKKDVNIKGRGGTTERFTQEAVSVTQALLEAKKEPFTVLKKDIVLCAQKVLNINTEAVAQVAEPPPPPNDNNKSEKGSKPQKTTVDQTISIVSLLLSAINIAKYSDSHSGADARRKKLEEIKEEYVAAANIKIS